MKTNVFVLSVLFILSILLTWLLFFWSPAEEQNATHKTLGISVAPTGGDFTVKTNNKDLSLHGLKGKVVLLYFGYTQCPDICPTSLALMTEAFKKMDKTALDSVQGLFISVDPKRDNPEKLAEYTSYFHPNIIGATSDKQHIDKIVKQYGASYRIVNSDSAMGYIVDHSSATYLIDKKGQLRETLVHGTMPDKITSAVHKLLEEE